jgi:peptidyl-prolyl cis-trans isomerase C
MHIKKSGCIWALFMALVLTAIVPLVSAGEKQPPSGKVATVNGVEISQEDFDREIRRVQARLRSSARSPGASELGQIRKEVLDSLVARELLYQESQRKGIKVESKTVDQQFEAMKKRFPDEAEFKKALESMSYSEATLRSQLERDQAVMVLIDQQFTEKLTVSNEEVKAYYDNHKDSFKKPEQVKASHILIKAESQADESRKTGARKKLEMIQGKLQKGEDFGTLAKEYSEGPSNVKGGDLGYFSRGQMVKPFEDAAFALQPGEVSGIVETRFGYHLIKVTDKTPETTLGFDDIKDRLGQYLKQEKLREEMDSYVESLRNKAKVEVFSKEDSK